mgnify:CR=1
MNVRDLIEVGQKAILSKTGDIVSKEKLGIGLAAIFEAIKVISADEDVTIYNFGTFSRKEMPEQIVSTQFTKHLPNGSVVVEKHLAPKFKPSKQYKAVLRYGQV